MTNEDRIPLKEFIKEIGEKDVVEQLNNYLVELQEIDKSQIKETVQQITIALDQDGDVTVATSIKLPNLKFKLGQLILESVSSGVAISSSASNPLTLTLAGIRFLRAVLQLSTVKISSKDAELLIALYKLNMEEPILSVDRLIEATKDQFVEDQITRSLERLEQLSCITLAMNEIILNETIVIRREN